jgi:hypothetical protein
VKIIESLYVPSEKDVIAGLNQRRIIRSFSATAGANVVTALNFYQVPVDQYFILETAHILVTVSGMTILRGSIQYFEPQGATVSAAWSVTPNVGTETQLAGAQSVGWCLVPGSTLNGFGTASGVPGNISIDGWISGFLIPRGNIES